MKHLLKRVLVSTAAAALLGCGSAALAADEAQPVIHVQLDGQELTFTDAGPQVKDERTFLPFRAVVEAMDAEVEWSADAPDAIVAKRGDVTVSMTLGSTAATVDKAGETHEFDMGVAPYSVADANDVWRTYVPVRFVAEAFDCAVGWDQDALTAVIVDTGKLVDAALEGKEFSYLEKLTAFSEKYTKGLWDCEMTMDGSFTLAGAEMPLSVTAQGTTEGETKVELDMNMKLDMSQFITLLEQMTGSEAAMAPEEQAMMDALADKGIDMKVRGDMDKGVIYMNMAGELLESAGMDADTWYSMDMNAIMSQSGMEMDWNSYLEAAKELDYTALLKTVLSAVEPDSAETDYASLKDAVEQISAALSDKGFKKAGKNYVSTVELAEDGAAVQMKITLAMSRDRVTGYDVEMSMTASVDETSAMTMGIVMAQDDKGAMSGKVTMDMSPMMAMDLDITGSYEKGKTAPITEPPAEAAVVDYLTLMNTPTEGELELGVEPVEE